MSLSSKTTTAAAPYEGPQPPENDTAHVYSFFLFRQPTGFFAPTSWSNGTYASTTTAARNNFSLTTITEQSGVVLLKGNHMLVQSADDTAAPSSPRNGTDNAPTTTGPFVPGATGAAGKVAAAVPALGLGALVAAVL